ncbi:ABC transporter permease [Microvirga alba]|uniref:ABC transporter permease n=1 Tax=Microvirga alba TaxID=2791025 RepID=A0A931BSS6_9HYPH|nr:ABC transporter permease [Microvirga alba]MBF9235333.1 ABC transporter permease [Microvirga alba]
MTRLDADLGHIRAANPRRGIRSWTLISTRIFRVHWMLLIGAAIFSTIALTLLVTPWIAPFDPSSQNILKRLASPSAAHWFGTDQLGRDVFTRVLYGGRFSVAMAAITLILCAVVGTIIGAISARAGGAADELLMRLVDLLVAFPDVVIALFLISVFGPGYGTLIVALTITGWTPFARLMRGLTLEVNTKEYIEAAEALGCSRWFIIFRHIIPNTLGPIFAISFLRFGHKLITVGALSFLGLGVQPPNSDWGAMLADARNFMDRMPWLMITPGLAVFITALSVTLIGKGIELERNRGRDENASSPYLK